MAEFMKNGCGLASVRLSRFVHEKFPPRGSATTAATGAASGVATTGAIVPVPTTANLARDLVREFDKLGFRPSPGPSPSPSSARTHEPETLERLRQSGAFRTVAHADVREHFGGFPLLPDTPEPPPPPPPPPAEEEAIHMFFLETLAGWCTGAMSLRTEGSGSLVHVCKTATLTYHGHSLYPDFVRARAPPTRRAAQPPGARPDPWNIACVFELKSADFTPADILQALEYGEALLTNSIRPEAYVALTNGASIQFFRVTPRDGTFAYLASDPLPLSAPIAKSLLCFMLTSEALFPNLPLFGDFRLAELQLLSETSNSRVVAATILTAPSGVASRDCVLKTVKLPASYVRNEKEALDALKTVAPHVPVVLAASSSALLLAPLGRRIKLIEGFFPEELVASFVAVLQRIHALGWCHRDLRPSNLLQTVEGQPLLIDFGFARQSGSEVVREGDLLYSADRLLQGEPGPYRATPQDDCEALVKVLYPMPTRWCQDLRRRRGDTAEYLRFWRMMAEWPPLKEALAAARREPIDYDALRRACERLLGRPWSSPL
ncbi:hypothetical protein PAPYR_7354 [Paratrimastix pyriformis]|uniref:Protein kinase domain-containing protein n=1 Tax=Paratrimastix pyriformis TaxID=342808 RepID=A0ABQ8UIE6_9EUKA|nr:hypothetical protein PAPYR_7354 [Paratrimastix pyriformis]